MKKFIVFLSLFVLIASPCVSFAAEIPPFTPGKVTPFKGYKAMDPIDLIDACPLQNIDTSQPKPTVTGFKGLLKITGANGETKSYDNRSGQMKNAAIELKPGDLINPSGGSATIHFSDGSSMALLYGTTVVYDELESLVKIKLLIGRVRILLPSVFLRPLRAKLAPKFETKMKVSAACIRGTDFVMEQSEDLNVGKYYLHEGTLDIVSTQGLPEVLEAGNSATVSGDGTVVVKKLDEATWSDLSTELYIDVASSTVDKGKPAAEEEKSSKSGTVAVGLGVVFVVAVLIYLKRRSG